MTAVSPFPLPCLVPLLLFPLHLWLPFFLLSPFLLLFLLFLPFLLSPSSPPPYPSPLLLPPPPPSSPSSPQLPLLLHTRGQLLTLITLLHFLETGDSDIPAYFSPLPPGAWLLAWGLTALSLAPEGAAWVQKSPQNMRKPTPKPQSGWHAPHSASPACDAGLQPSSPLQGHPPTDPPPYSPPRPTHSGAR